MEMVTNQTPADLNVKPKLKRNRKGRKREASDGCAVQGMIQKDRSMHDIGSGKNGMMPASSYSQEKLVELDFTEKWSQESPKSGSVTTTNPLKKPSKSEKKRVKRKANGGCPVESMDLKDTNMHVTENGKNGIIAEPCSPVKPVELDSTAKLSQENPKSSDDTTMNPLKKLSNSERRSRGGKRKTNEGMNQKDKSMHDIENGKNGMIVEPCSPDKPMELDSTTKLCQENPKYAVDTTTNPLEKPSKSQRKWLRRLKREANGGCAVQVMDQKDKNMYDIENGKAEPGSSGKAVELDSTAKLSQENPKSDDDTTNNPLEKLSKSKKKHRGGKREANEHMNQKDKSMHDIENDKNGMIVEPCSPEKPKSAVETTSNPLEKPSKSERKRLRRMKKEANGGCAVQGMDQKAKNMYDAEKRKNGMIAEPCSSGKPMELDSTAKLSPENPKYGEVTLPNPLEKLSNSKGKKLRKARKKAAAKLKFESMDHKESGGDTLTNPLNKLSDKRKRLRKASKKAATNLGSESMDLTNIVSNLSLADASDAYAGDNVNCGTDLSQESRRFTGNGICNRVDMRHKSSIVTIETHNNCLSDPYRIIQRRKLLILDVNGLLADVVFPAPQGCQPHTRTLGRAIFKRPFYLDFLNFCFEKFDVGIWSSRTKRVLDNVVDCLLGDLKRKLRFCWDASHCTETKFKTLENRHKPMVFKELRKLWEKHDPSLPWKKGDYDESNTLLVDDSPYKALLNPIHTGIFPYSYTYHNKSDNLLGPGGEIRVYLEGLAAAGNVQHYVAQNPFGQSAINKTNPSWNFYSEVLQSLLSTSG